MQTKVRLSLCAVPSMVRLVKNTMACHVMSLHGTAGRSAQGPSESNGGEEGRG